MTTLQDKTPEELNVICAELCGWKRAAGNNDSVEWIRPSRTGVFVSDYFTRDQLPPYATSYDAIMPCVKALTDKQTFAFIEHLRVIRNIQATGDFAFTWLMMTSSGADLTRALILTLTT